ncbi:nucleoporin Nup37 [Anthonomus grandis grandis]|uniref:nucleoporin Nup37 n=1 Tax=Anthonomus grandis grandis TaxID=2921223 RepID=UPI002165225C|nr:nucleoporin Nup37 [Anthonomus grandis grandis]
MRDDFLMHTDAIDASKKNSNEPIYVKDFSEYGQILHIHFSPYEWTKDVMLLAFEEKILFVHLSFENSISINKVYEFPHPRCSALAISPNSSLAVLPNQVIFATGSSDFKLRVYESDLEQNTLCRELSGHVSYINDVTFDPENLYMASASDDNTVKLWFTDGFRLKSTFHLNSPAMVVSWHRADSGKMLVAEKIGLIKFYNVDTETPILSLDFAKSLSSAHWAPSDSQILGTLQLGELLVWDLTKPCLPQQSTILFPENGGTIKFSPQGELVAAVNNLDGSLKVVHTVTQHQKLNVSLSLPSNVQWHYHYPIVCVGDDMKLCFWKVSTK